MASNEMIKTAREFKVWRAQFCYSLKGKRAMDKMKSLPRGENEFPYGNLESSVLQVCFQASKFMPKNHSLDSRGRIAGMQFPIVGIKNNGKRQPSHVARNSMILYLTTFFRFYTSDESTFEFVGKKVPSFGKGRPDVVADFVNAVFKNESSDEISTERLIRQLTNKGVRLAHWKYFQ